MEKIPGLIVTFNPPLGFFSNLIALPSQMDRILVVDNGSDPEVRRLLERAAAEHEASITVLFNAGNLGVAAALNRGFHWALEQGYQYVIPFDQDSLPVFNMAGNLWAAYKSHSSREKIAIVAPQIQDDITGEKIEYLRARGAFLIERTACRSGVIEDVLLVITSGSLYSLAAYQKIGAFREDLFIDYVDTEYCLRARALGYKILVACSAMLRHRLGEQRRKQVGPLALRPTFHAPLRWYYINRNRVALYRWYALRFPGWAIHDFLSGCYAVLKMIVYEDRRLRKILSLALGLLDGVSSRMGPISRKRKTWIAPER